ncbi:MAG: hypothetical protein KIT84_13815 [Labilithrix sp.]|nr:hypothetical protein [Labilithrix sp.]MCW5812096.1 hypothetical protein [Labilithrix sp.]
MALAARVLSYVTVASIIVACWPNGGEDCSAPGTPAVCTGPSTFERCIRNEGGGTTLLQLSCPDRWQCREGSARIDPCFGGAVGEACQSDEHCEQNLRCESETCAGPTAEEIARCESAPTITLAADGAAVEVDVPLSDDTAVLVRTKRPNCRETLDGGIPQYGRIGFLRVNGDFADADPIRIEYPSSGVGAIVAALDSIRCADLYDRLRLGRQCFAGPRTETFRVLSQGSGSTTLVIALEPSATELGIRLQVRRDPVF